jgi:murein DD-endopeptidase MepM/ murein hydrolase activator NlpD
MNFLAFLQIVSAMFNLAFADLPHVKAPDFVVPLEAMDNRPLLLTFGLYVTPEENNNPIDPPERWTGYHAALDIEIYPDEIEKDVPVYAICEGSVIFTGEVNGYGGVLIQSCKYENEPITVLYGHIDPYRIQKKVADNLGTKDKIGFLGDHKTKDAGYNRKHLHLQIHRGQEIVFRGYVQRPEELSAYIDPQKVINFK